MCYYSRLRQGQLGSFCARRQAPQDFPIFRCFRQARVSCMGPIFRHAAKTFGLLKEKKKGHF